MFLRTVRALGVFFWLSLATGVASFQQPLNWAADDGKRVETLKTDGSRLDGEHLVLWFPPSLTRPDAEALLKKLDPAQRRRLRRARVGAIGGVRADGTGEGRPRTFPP